MKSSQSEQSLNSDPMDKKVAILGCAHPGLSTEVTEAIQAGNQKVILMGGRNWGKPRLTEEMKEALILAARQSGKNLVFVNADGDVQASPQLMAELEKLAEPKMEVIIDELPMLDSCMEPKSGQERRRERRKKSVIKYKNKKR